MWLTKKLAKYCFLRAGKISAENGAFFRAAVRSMQIVLFGAAAGAKHAARADCAGAPGRRLSRSDAAASNHGILRLAQDDSGVLFPARFAQSRRKTPNDYC
ncbi:MAG: hypothetical protein IKQ10_06720 [Oscillospiraceae bacterium]|nr:hypothetical protein [Oscillospiraceae bacterium]